MSGVPVQGNRQLCVEIIPTMMGRYLTRYLSIRIIFF
ncbi:hypothetical protein ISN45_At04g029780 [Arabidopsis thaliana x Arabidopsis arenosa]|uniref:Uncharacterized protein n=2 Tax=Arabidopsis TaxID=3701 RepID=A0A8T2EK09_ARASU|nr:hypothetical protein ISN45_At04g029780 [Arabidopsis thaliana x Arabidopsis arenosa]KAG7622093.1 hypothetical protein ISN44_As04g029230 [Arabidopsis suecica]